MRKSLILCLVSIFALSGCESGDGGATTSEPETTQIITNSTTFSTTSPSTYTEQFTITFINWNSETLETKICNTGETPVYLGTVPTKELNDGYTYIFTGWYPTILPANCDAVYIAQFEQHKDISTSVPLSTSTSEYTNVPTSESTTNDSTCIPTSEFISDISTTTSDIPASISASESTSNQTASVLTSQSTEEISINYYTVKWLNCDGTLLYKDTYAEGETITYPYENPIYYSSVSSTNPYVYCFSNWDKNITYLQSNETITAVYDKLRISDYCSFSIQTGTFYDYHISPNNDTISTTIYGFASQEILVAVSDTQLYITLPTAVIKQSLYINGVSNGGFWNLSYRIHFKNVENKHFLARCYGAVQTTEGQSTRVAGCEFRLDIQKAPYSLSFANTTGLNQSQLYSVEPCEVSEDSLW